ncbi:unnamed protein product [Brassica oleracea var. botrytis]
MLIDRPRQSIIELALLMEETRRRSRHHNIRDDTM